MGQGGDGRRYAGSYLNTDSNSARDPHMVRSESLNMYCFILTVPTAHFVEQLDIRAVCDKAREYKTPKNNAPSP